MRIVSDTGPIIGLAKIDCLFLFKNLASEVCIPPMVYRELLGKIGFESERIENALHDFIQVMELKSLKPEVKEKISDLDEGEKQTIALASMFSRGVLLVLDDHAGRKVANKLNIPTTGIIGILLLAKKNGILREVGPFVDELRNQGYWLSDEIVLLAKSLAGEK